MRCLANRITRFIVSNSYVDEKEFEIYEYGFQIGIEACICVGVTFVEALLLGMVVEWMLFFVVFIPLRSYAGGLHMNSFGGCFILSNIVFLNVLLISRQLSVESDVLFWGTVLLLLCIYFLYPIENSNRIISSEERVSIKNKFNKIICRLFLIPVTMLALSYEKGLKLMMLTLLMIVITMILGKVKNQKH